MKDEDGAGFTITPLYALLRMGSLSPRGTVYPPQPGSVIYDYLCPKSRKISGHAERVRSERHNPHSIATLRITLARYLIRQLPSCPFCGPKRL
jgi:hypothetical protein